MRTSVLGASVIAALAFLQGVPAPPALIAIGISASTATVITSGATSGLISGSIGASVGAGVACAKGGCRRRREAIRHATMMAREVAEQLDARAEAPGPPKAPEGVPQYNIDNCYNDALNAKVTVTGPIGDNHIRIEGLPSTCMVLSTVLDGNTDGGPTPTPCGSACIEYSGMTPDEYENIRQTLNTQVLNKSQN
ncbi:hypothetical protein GGS26DRAFT_587747 [Hypomontagnella submonticulosa]|nr:hypothetical protein GGS26DRAFT_587747 [Hypomontagnella submonticulosa]